MEQKKFNLWKNIIAVAVLAISSFVYLATIEPTASFWDCGEFIASSYKLEVGHPPGNPVFQVIARFFTVFADNMHAAMAVNCCSALCSAFTIFFLFLTIVHFGRRISVRKGEDIPLSQVITILGAGVAGALAYCFSDTFWFSAVEGEVYAMSSLVTAVVFWAILRWEDEAGEPYADRWLVLIALLMGLSIGIHLLNLLVIPPIVFIYYYKMHENEHVSLLKAFGVLCLSGVILAVILFGIIPYVPKIIATADRIAVNGFGAPFNLGAAIFSVLMFAFCFFLLNRFRIKQKVVAHTITLCLTTILIGYSVFAVVVIRANANPPTNEYSPDNPYTLVRYLGREQYGSNPIVYGQAFTSPYDIKESKYWTPLEGKYYRTEAPLEATYPSGAKMFFPRMWSTQTSAHRNFYEAYTAGNYKVRRVQMGSGRIESVPMPRMIDNLVFFFDYQFNHMYLRYFLWNFVGRQNDIQAQSPGDVMVGNWESGIKFLDKARLGDSSVGPDYMVDSKAKNHYYFLPLILGLIGFFFQLKKDARGSWINTLLFILTGFAIIIYLNQPPYQPRERDYAYAGSFYVFAIWIGLAVLPLKDWIGKLFSAREEKSGKAVASASVASALALAVAVLMGCENWDDHDRSGRYTVTEHAWNYLNSCDENAILITHGDNDTFPLWYAQEVENVRTDIRIMNTSLLGMDWYIDQMKCRSNNSAPLPISLPRKDYLYGTNDFVRVYPEAFGKAATVQDVMTVFKMPRYREGNTGIIATDTIRIPVNKENALKYGIVREEDADKMLDYLTWIIPKDATTISKTDLIILDIMSNYQWDRPIYFVSQKGDCTFDVENCLQFDGYAYKIVPLYCETEEPVKQMDVDKMYDRVMNVYRYNSLADTDINFDYTNLYTFSSVTPVRGIFNNVAAKLLADGRWEDAEKVLDRCYEVTPQKNIPYNLSYIGGTNEYEVLTSVDLYLHLDRFEKAQALSRKYVEEAVKTMIYSVQSVKGYVIGENLLRRDMNYLSYLATMFSNAGYKDEFNWIQEQIDNVNR